MGCDGAPRAYLQLPLLGACLFRLAPGARPGTVFHTRSKPGCLQGSGLMASSSPMSHPEEMRTKQSAVGGALAAQISVRKQGDESVTLARSRLVSSRQRHALRPERSLRPSQPSIRVSSPNKRGTTARRAAVTEPLSALFTMQAMLPGFTSSCLVWCM